MKLKMQFNTRYFMSEIYLFSIFRLLKTGSLSPWCLIVSSFGCLRFHVLVEHLVLSLSLHLSTTLEFPLINSSARFRYEKIILCYLQMLSESTSTKLTLCSISHVSCFDSSNGISWLLNCLVQFSWGRCSFTKS